MDNHTKFHLVQKVDFTMTSTAQMIVISIDMLWDIAESKEGERKFHMC